MLDAEFFVALGFVIFVVLLGYLGVHNKLAGALDGRIDKIKSELAEAARLRAEAQALMQSFAAKTAEAEAQAASIVAQAKAEAEACRRRPRRGSRNMSPAAPSRRRKRSLRPKPRPTADVRSAAADAAVKAAETVLKSSAAASRRVLRRAGHRQRQGADELTDAKAQIHKPGLALRLFLAFAALR